MTSRRSNIAVLLLSALLAVGCVGITGCGTTPATKMAQANQLVITSVNDGEQELVAKINAGQMKQSQIDRFHKFHDAYYAAQMTLKAINLRMAVAESDPSLPPVSAADQASATQARDDAESALLNLLNSYLR